MNIHRAFQRTQVVYFFECFDVHAGRTLVPPFKATAEAIRRVFKGKPLPNSAEEVDERELDDEGRWFRLATGWGMYTDDLG